MSKDIRSFFPTVCKKVGDVPTEQVKKTPKTKRSFSSIDSSSEDVILGTPQEAKKRKTTLNIKDHSRSTRKRIVPRSSDSEPENDGLKKKSKSSTKTVAANKEGNVIKHQGTEHAQQRKEKAVLVKQKKISPLDAFGDDPIKQEKLPGVTEVNVLSDDDFNQTLLQLDEDEELVKAAARRCAATESTPKKTFDTPNREMKSSTKTRHGKTSESDSGLDPDQERHEKRRHSAMLYQKYLNRSGPVHPGSKWIPHGNSDCLNGLCFIISGVLECLQRDEAQTLVEEHGGRCLKSLSGKINYMVLGEDAGPSKLEKARKLGTKMISEDELIELICARSNIKNQNMVAIVNDTKPMISDEKMNIKIANGEEEEEEEKEKEKEKEKKKKKKESSQTAIEIPSVTERTATTRLYLHTSKPSTSKVIDIQPLPKKDVRKTPTVDMAWVDKYKPSDVSQIIGQQGERSNVKKLIDWLRSWHRNQNGKTKLVRPSPWAKNDDGAFFKAALLSGPPGVGKTTTATLVAKHLGFDTVEFNASDTRNKKMVHKEIAQILNSTSIAGFVTHGSAPTKKHVLLMDEVDGMSGNEDRGGIQELIALIKDAQVPIICMCNDRQHPKIRTLANYCFDLRFAKPRVEQIRGAMLSICFKENVKINADAMTQVIQGTGMDVRQTLNQLSILAVTGNGVSSDDATKRATQSQKDSKLGPWEVIRKVFTEEEHKKMSVMDKAKLFFYDYSIGPLFVQENYLKVIPHCLKKNQLQRFADAADCISLGDVVDAKIRSTQNWSLLEMQAMYASVLPGHLLSGHFGGQIDFPGWLGKNSKANKFYRMQTELYGHTRTSTSGNKDALTLDYMTHIHNAVVFPLAHDGTSGIPKALRAMTDYKLLREDLTNIIELAHWPKSKDLFASVDSKVKAAFTRAYNKDCTVLPYSTQGGPAKKKLGAALSTQDAIYDQYEEDNDDGEVEQDDDINGDSMIKTKIKISKTESIAKSKASAKPKGSKRRSAK